MLLKQNSKDIFINFILLYNPPAIIVYTCTNYRLCCFGFSNEMHDDIARKLYFSLEYSTKGGLDEF